MKKVCEGITGCYRRLLLILALLVLQVGCTLALPYLTAGMIDIGVGQGGIPSALATHISAEGMEKLLLLMNQEEQEKVCAGYRNEGQVYTKNEMNREEEEALADLMTPPMVAVYALSTDGADYKEVLGEDLYVPRELDAFGILKLLPEDARLELTKAARERIAAIPLTLVHQAAVNFIREDLEIQGVHVQELQDSYLLKKVIFMVLSVVGIILSAVLSARFLARLSADYAFELRRRMVRQVFNLDEEQAASFSVNDLIGRTMEDTEKIQHFLRLFLQEILCLLLLGVGGTVLAWRMSRQLGTVVLTAFGVALFLLAFFTTIGHRSAGKIQNSKRHLLRMIRENLRGMMVIRVFGQEKREQEQFHRAAGSWSRMSARAGRTCFFLTPGLLLVMNVGFLWLAKNSASGINQGWLQSGEYVACIQYMILVIGACLSVADQISALPEGVAAYRRVAQLLALSEEKETCCKGEATEDKRAPILCFEHATCQYPGSSEAVLQDISFSVRAGETVAVVGGLGTGKTALLLMALGKMKIREGRVLINGKEAASYDRKWLAGAISYIPQNPKLFSGSIAQNLRFRKKDASDAELMEAVRTAQAEVFVSQMEKGLEAAVSPGGTNFSGGQRQRLAAARSMVGDARIYLFDDCYSALDAKTALQLKAALAKKTKDAAVLMTASRLELIQDADQILVLDHGRIAGVGRHEELLQSCDVYRELAASQGCDIHTAGEVTQDVY
ncbi:ABC transporter ATP-binding protein [bacterium 1XD42-54]|nr:ABC transporter ATP-binding protein [bacterium 1XD42-54]